MIEENGTGRRPIVTLMTDFQEGSPYVAQMKGVLYSRVPEVQVVDVTHSVPPQNVLYGACVLAETASFFPAGTIHVAVVDPEVGSRRKLVCAQANAQFFLCPENGLLTEVIRKFSVQRVFEIRNPECFLPEVSATFHGRDVLAPTAAFLAQGRGVELVGPALASEELRRLPIPQASANYFGISGTFLYADSFGNLVTNVTRDVFEAYVSRITGGQPGSIMRIGNSEFATDLRFVRTYSDCQPGTRVILWGSQGRLELAVVNGSAQQELPWKSGDAFRLH